MAKKNHDFFNEKKPWSEVKDELLGCYLKPYLQKILHTGHPVVYVDCFAGKGAFADGKPGSPLIALQTIQECLCQTRMQNCNIRSYFIDVNYAEDLCKNLHGYTNVNIISGRYEEQIAGILKSKNGCNVFLYVDPYGIKALNCSLFDSFASQRFNSIELLINMNSFGFIREGCRVLGIKFEENELMKDLIEYDSTQLASDENSKAALNKIAGGDYWINIIEKKRKGEISAYDAEAEFADAYCKRLRKSYTYVLNMPLRIKPGQVPKYRMIHATNHPAGALIMVDNIFGRWELMQDIQNGGQQSFWDEDIDNGIIDESEIELKVMEHLSRFTIFTRMNPIMADFYCTHGVICPSKTVKEIYKKLEKSKKLEVRRTPSTTATGRASTFFADEKKQITELRWRG